ncbi:SDR family oxidoreductase [Dickeya dianthicola]|uniref:SDR family oxidoreductase n=1 Tax=Dickeya dianthicola TaxID=204039 RepID=UPI00136A55E1|nr:SDR family oxidoreductase [Dickeya dianthicola]MCI4185248.1 SDR family oxidoreductase [Dickeya dianthicola]MCI4237730.1 SDR family oxidoreductase [Dickeya dianthicola]MCI4256132.1 SDR family oxidoreductase [Dickeya dianthicola]MZG23369.1 SDR family oxidoreductase [Dickeya dianthicola]MZI90611.1 SDR family oxidoreductase [Dickeya dianthicola]
MIKNISGKVIVITGASSGIGEAAARLLSSEGAWLVLGARRLDKLEEISQDLINSGGKVEVFKTDVSQRQDVDALVNKAMTIFGRVDVLINNAGVMPNSRLDQLRVEDWEYAIDINLKGTLYGIAAVLPIMKKQNGGHIINISSLSGHRVRPSSAVYSATKFAVRAISEGVRMEMTPWNIRCTVISPGPVDTELPASVTDEATAGQVRKAHEIAISPVALAETIMFAISQPDSVDINEILLRPTAME